MRPLLVEIGEKFAKRRDERGLSVREVALGSGNSTATVSRMENGLNSNLSMTTFLNACFSLGMDPRKTVPSRQRLQAVVEEAGEE